MEKQSQNEPLVKTWPDSSNVQRAKYWPESKVLTITFNGGARYQYDNVPMAEWEGLSSAGSAGSYVHTHIKAQYTYQRL